ncbi:hypothetical protein [Geobacter sp.]|uniref:hypothetical protein n=1 Tax=Geobacter sp. TaxID=46610 RepID=UPI00262F3B9D|nr:hypothetical protein [Geobacter sp.]
MSFMQRLILWYTTALLAFGALNAVAAPTGKQTVTFDGERYHLAYTNENGTLEEYLPAGQTLENWTKMIALRHHGDVDQPAAAVRNMAAHIKATYPGAGVDHMVKQDGSEALIDFFIWTNEQPIVAEFNVFRFRKLPGVRGLVSYQFAYRNVGSLSDEYAEAFKKNRTRWIGLMTKTTYPAPPGTPR